MALPPCLAGQTTCCALLVLICLTSCHCTCTACNSCAELSRALTTIPHDPLMALLYIGWGLWCSIACSAPPFPCCSGVLLDSPSEASWCGILPQIMPGFVRLTVSLSLLGVQGHAFMDVLLGRRRSAFYTGICSFCVCLAYLFEMILPCLQRTAPP